MANATSFLSVKEKSAGEGGRMMSQQHSMDLLIIVCTNFCGQPIGQGSEVIAGDMDTNEVSLIASAVGHCHLMGISNRMANQFQL